MAIGILPEVAIAALLATGALGHSASDDARVDIIELNHYCDGNGALVFHQVIFWRWNHVAARHHVCAWKIVKTLLRAPRRERDHWIHQWWEAGRLQRVRAPCFRETWTQYDPEEDDQQWVPRDERSGL